MEGRKLVIKINGMPLRTYIDRSNSGKTCNIPIDILKETLELRDERNKSFSEIGEEMGITRGSARYRYGRAKELLNAKSGM